MFSLSTRRILFYAAIFAAFCGTLWFFSDIVTYVLIAWVLSLLGRPLARFYRRIGFGSWRLGDVPGTVLTLITMVGTIVGVASMIIPEIIEQAQNLSEVNYAKIGKTLEKPLNSIAQQLRYGGWIPRGRTSALSSIQQRLLDEFEPSQLTHFVSNAFGTVSELFIAIGIVMFILFFFLKDENLFTNALKGFVPVVHEEKVEMIVNDTSLMLQRYVLGLLMQLTVFATCVGGGLWFLGVPNALLIGFIGGLFNLVPYVGPIIAASFGVLLTISSNLDLDFYDKLLPLCLKVLVTFFSTQFLDNFILHPYIFSNSVKAHPLEVFLVVLLGAKLGGAPGMILAMPVYTTGKIILKAFFKEYKFVKFLTGNMDEPIFEFNDEKDKNHIEQEEIN